MLESSQLVPAFVMLLTSYNNSACHPSRDQGR